MPTEQELCNKPLVQHRVPNDQVVWYDADNNVFCVADANSGDAGDAFQTYDELYANV